MTTESVNTTATSINSSATPELASASDHTETDDYTYNESIMPLYVTNRVGEVNKDPPIIVAVEVNKKELEMELDTGAAKTVIPEAIYKEHWSHIPLKKI